LKVVIKIETEKIESVKVYMREILNQMARNKHFSITNYKMEIGESDF